MDQKEQHIREDIEGTRTAMSEKIEMIEGRVHETMEGTKTTIDSVMDSVKQIQDTVEQTKSAIDNVLDTIKHSMDETIERAKYTADLIAQVNQNPWLMFGCAILTGYVLSGIDRQGSLGPRHDPEVRRSNSGSQSSPSLYESSAIP
jgi:hypothetical protein